MDSCRGHACELQSACTSHLANVNELTRSWLDRLHASHAAAHWLHGCPRARRPLTQLPTARTTTIPSQVWSFVFCFVEALFEALCTLAAHSTRTRGVGCHAAQESVSRTAGAGCVYTQTAGDHSPLFGIMADSIPIYGQLSVGGVVPTDLDECGGHTDTKYPFYHYHVSRPRVPMTAVRLGAIRQRLCARRSLLRRRVPGGWATLAKGSPRVECSPSPLGSADAEFGCTSNATGDQQLDAAVRDQVL